MSAYKGLAYIRKVYGVPAYRGQRVRYDKGGGETMDGTITAAQGMSIVVSFGGVKVALHPTRDLHYLGKVALSALAQYEPKLAHLEDAPSLTEEPVAPEVKAVEGGELFLVTKDWKESRQLAYEEHNKAWTLSNILEKQRDFYRQEAHALLQTFRGEAVAQLRMDRMDERAQAIYFNEPEVGV